MNRRDLLKGAVPVAAIAVAKMADGIHRADLAPGGHFLFFIDQTKIDVNDFLEMGNEQVPLLPAGSRGGWIVAVHGDVESAVKIFRLDGDMQVSPEDLPNGAIRI
jgi:hypothetical protein